MNNKLDKMIEALKITEIARIESGLLSANGWGIQVVDCRDYGVDYETENISADEDYENYNYRLSFEYNGVTFYSIHEEM